MAERLPIDDVLGEIARALAAGERLVLAAPPGAGKTTRAPLALASADWLEGRRILLLEPRRIAARMAAERMAATLGERVGATVGLSTRIDRRVSAKTRIEVVTDGLFTRRILGDPELSGVGAVLFDEFHERSLNLDLGLAFALETQSALRRDLRLVVMSATLDTARIAKTLDAPVVASEGRLHPVETIYLGRAPDRLDDRVARAVRRALGEQQGSILVFLPGTREILSVASRLEKLPDDVIVAPLFGALSPAEQDRAVAPAPNGRRKVVLSTDIAESSLTIDGVNTVIDAGYARIAEHDALSGGSTLATRRAARANVDQRRGRAGRIGPGVCYRLWDEEETRGLSAEPTPEILLADLSGFVLALAEWGERDPARLTFIDPPPQGRLSAARAELGALGAIDAAGALTTRGREIARLPLAPRLAAMIVSAATPADRALAAEIAALIGERGLGGASTDIRERIDRFRKDAAPRARTLREQAARWGGDALGAPSREAGRIIASATPGAIARAREGERGVYLAANGRAARLDANDALAGARWLAIAELSGAAASARILTAAQLDEADALALGGVETVDLAEFDPEKRAFRARRVRRMGAITLSETPLAAPGGEAARGALIAAIRTHGFSLLAAGGAIAAAVARFRLARGALGLDAAAFDEASLAARVEEWLAPLLGDPPSLDRPGADALQRAAFSLIDWDLSRKIDVLAPLTYTAPSGRVLAIDYLADGGPKIEARVQEFYGAASHPAILNGALALTASLLSPAGRPVAVTKDIASFWRGGYRDMAKDMRGRYPKHDWPEEPASARAHVGRTKARLKSEQ